MTIKITALLGFILISLAGIAQTAPFGIHIEPINISGLGGLQSYAFGQHNGKWLIIGGRLDGLHRRQPFAAFDVAGHNNQLIVVDPMTKQKWIAPLSSLPTGIQEQLSSTNMQFYQEGDYLYCLGGYGYSATIGDHTTYDKLTAVKVSDVINAVISNTSFTPYFRQISDSKFQVTGGRLKKIYNNYYLLGGQKFIGRYNPMGPTHGPGFVQEYTDAIRIFTISDNGTAITINHITSYVDSANLHRRDYNAESQILPNGEEGITMFSGVFQHTVDLPFLNSVTVDSSGFTVNNSFQQYYNHYHSAVIPMYSTMSNEMHNVFFGGIAQYYDSAGVLVQDNNVPFVKTIARVSRDGSGNMAEYKLPVELPTLLGAGAEFIAIDNLPKYNNEVLKLDDFSNDSTLVGYIYGGISSSAKNIFFTNTGTQSSASNQIFEVYVLKGATVGIDEINEESVGTLKIRVYPNPNHGDFVVKFNLRKNVKVKIALYSSTGSILEETILRNLSAGENSYTANIENLEYGGTYFLTIETPYEKSTRKIIIQR